MDVSLLAYLISQVQFNLSESVASTLKFLNEQSGILTISSILAAIGVFFYQQYEERKNKKQEFNDRLRRACKLLLVDFTGWESWAKIKNDMPYTENIYSMENYHSIVNSGLITNFTEVTQGKLTVFYHYLELHNRRIFDMNDMVNSIMNSSEVHKDRLQQLQASFAWTQNQQQLNLYDIKMREFLPTVERLILDELGRTESL